MIISIALPILEHFISKKYPQNTFKIILNSLITTTPFANTPAVQNWQLVEMRRKI